MLDARENPQKASPFEQIQGLASGEPSIEVELERSIEMQRWPGGTASNVGLLNLAAPTMLQNARNQESFISNDIKLPNGLIKKFNDEIKMNNLQKNLSQIAISQNDRSFDNLAGQQRDQAAAVS